MGALQLNSDQQKMLAGRLGGAKQMAMRLLIDLAAAAGAEELIPIQSAHISGVSPLTGGLGLRRFLTRLVEDDQAQVAVPTTLNAAGCDSRQFEAMRIAVPGFLEESQEIIRLYSTLGIKPTQSCIPYEWDGVVTSGTAAWAESNAICFGNSYCQLVTNRESGLSALAAALTGYTPKYGLLESSARHANLRVVVTAELSDPTDFSILGDWIGMQRQADWLMPYGPIPLISGLPSDLSHEQKKALSAAAANFGCPLLYIEGQGPIPESPNVQAVLSFSEADLQIRYHELRPRAAVSLVAIGCPQASIGEIRAAARLLQGIKVSSSPDDRTGLPPLWIFTSSANKAIADQLGLSAVIKESGALLLENTCPEVVPYDPTWVKHILTNSMKAEHYLKSGLNSIPASVMTLTDCIAVAAGEVEGTSFEGDIDEPGHKPEEKMIERPAWETESPALLGSKSASRKGVKGIGQGLPSQDEFVVRGRALVTDTPITLLGYVNRESGIIEEPGHPANGQSLAGKVAIFPRGTGSTVAPYVLLELFYRGKAPLAIVNTEIDQQSAPACSLEGIPYAFGFGTDLFNEIINNDLVELRKQGSEIEIRIVEE